MQRRHRVPSGRGPGPGRGREPGRHHRGGRRRPFRGPDSEGVQRPRLRDRTEGGGTKAALDSGADRAVGPGEARPAFRDFAADAGADVAIDFVGTKSTFDLGRSLLGPGGRFVAVAPGRETIDVAASDLVNGGKGYLGAYSSTMADFARAISLAEAGRLRPVVTRKAPLADAAEVLNDLRAGKIVGRAVLFPGPMDP